MIKGLIISILAIVNVAILYWMFWFLILLDNSANGFFIPRSVVESGSITSLILRWFIVLIEALSSFAVLAFGNFVIFEKIGLSNSKKIVRILFLIEVFVAMTFMTYILISIAASMR